LYAGKNALSEIFSTSESPKNPKVR
jgi:hypothetical protein